MNAQATPSPYTPAGGSNMTIGAPPVLGAQVPGTTGGLPALSGLSVMQNPLPQPLQSMQPQQSAQHAQQFGRGEDTVLVHMTPAEVNSLQGLAMASGGSLTINPHTGLPEAGWLGKLLPTLLGFGLNFIPGIGPLAAAGIVAAGQTAITGDLKKGLMAGLQAYGGAGISGAVAPGATASGAVTKLGTEAAAKMAAEKAAVTAAQQGVTAAGTDVAAKAVAQKALDEALKNQVTKMPGLLDKFGTATSLGAKGIVGKALPMIAGTAVVGGVSDAMQPKLPTYKPEETKPYVRMAPAKREVRYPTPEELQRMGSAEFNYFTPSNPEPVPASTTPYGSDYGFADGGAVGSNAGLDALIASYQAQSPGAITASMRPNPLPAYVAPTAPAASSTTTSGTSGTGLGSYTATPSQSGGETQYAFSRKPMGPGNTYGSNFGGFGSFGGLNLGDLSNIDFSQFMNPSQPQLPAPETPDYSGIDFSGMDFSQYTPPASEVQVPTPSYLAPQISDFSGMDFSQFTPTMPSSDENQFFSAPQVSDFSGTDYSQFTPAAPSYDESQYFSATPAAPSYDKSQYFSATPAAPSYDFSQFAPQVEAAQPAAPASVPDYSALRLPDFSGMDFSRFAPQIEAAQPAAPASAPGYSALQLPDFSQYTPQTYAPEPTPSYDYYSRFDEQNYPMFDNFSMYAGGGSVDMRDGSFVLDARTVSEIGNGSSNAGMELLSRLGGKPVRGPGDGVSDSVKASIGGTQEARVARDEVILPPEAVRRIGGGSEKRGTQKLYALMDKAHKARKKAKRGQDTKLRRGLA